VPLIHFAFGKLFRSGDEQDQLDSFIEHILLPKTLMASECKEFMPIINSPNALLFDPRSARVHEGGGIVLTDTVQPLAVSLLPNSVRMVSFVDIPIRKLCKWSPSDHYGRLGIAFADTFRERFGVRRVDYYQYPELERDPLVLALNQAKHDRDLDARDRLYIEVVHYRKPAQLWEEFNTLFAPAACIRRATGNRN